MTAADRIEWPGMTWDRVVPRAALLGSLGVRRVCVTRAAPPRQLQDLRVQYPWEHVTTVSPGLVNGAGVRDQPCFLALVPGGDGLGLEWSLDTRNHDTGIGLNVPLVRAVMGWLMAPVRQEWAHYLIDASQALNERAAQMLQSTAQVQRISGQLQDVAALSVASTPVGTQDTPDGVWTDLQLREVAS